MRGIKFMGLNLLLCVPTAMWIAQIEVWLPAKPFSQVSVPLSADRVGGRPGPGTLRRTAEGYCKPGLLRTRRTRVSALSGSFFFF